MEEKYIVDLSYVAKNKLVIQAPPPQPVMIRTSGPNPLVLAAAGQVLGMRSGTAIGMKAGDAAGYSRGLIQGTREGRVISAITRSRVRDIIADIPKEIEVSTIRALGDRSTLLSRLANMSRNDLTKLQRQISDLDRINPQNRINLIRNYIADNPNIPANVRAAAVEYAMVRQQKALEFQLTGTIDGYQTRVRTTAENLRNEFEWRMRTWTKEERDAVHHLSSLLGANPIGRQYLSALRQKKSMNDTLNIGTGE